MTSVPARPPGCTPPLEDAIFEFPTSSLLLVPILRQSGHFKNFDDVTATHPRPTPPYGWEVVEDVIANFQ